jgi:hypothetical protein
MKDESLTRATNVSKNDKLWKYSNPIRAQKMARKYLGPSAILYKSKNKNKKYSVKSPSGKFINFGAIGYEDYTKHKDKKRRGNYLKRSKGILGKWKKNKYSPNNLSIHILWCT